MIVNEAKNQKELGRERAILDLGYFLEQLELKFKAPVPKKVLDELWRMLKKQADKKDGKSGR